MLITRGAGCVEADFHSFYTGYQQFLVDNFFLVCKLLGGLVQGGAWLVNLRFRGMDIKTWSPGWSWREWAMVAGILTIRQRPERMTVLGSPGGFVDLVFFIGS